MSKLGIHFVWCAILSNQIEGEFYKSGPSQNACYEMRQIVCATTCTGYTIIFSRFRASFTAGVKRPFAIYPFLLCNLIFVH